MTVPGIAAVWDRIKINAGSEFRMIKGATFRYKIVSGCVDLGRTNHRIHKSDFEKALALVPLKNTVVIKDRRGASYLYAILMDDRIRQDDW